MSSTYYGPSYKSDAAFLAEAVLGFVCASIGHWNACAILSHRWSPFRRLYYWAVLNARAHGNPTTGNLGTTQYMTWDWDDAD